MAAFAMLFLAACGSDDESYELRAVQTDLQRYQERYRAITAENEAIIENLQRQNAELRQENQILRQQQAVDTPATALDIFVLDAGRSWWNWVLGQPTIQDFTMRIYQHPEAWYDFDNPVLVEISSENWQGRIKAAIEQHRGIVIDDIWFEQDRLVVDLCPEDAVRFNWGTSGGYFRTRALIDSLATVPNVAEIVVLIAGERGVWADHFSFAEIFRVVDGQWGRGN